MKTLNIAGKDITMEFTFAAAEYKELVQKMFEIMTGSYAVRNGKSEDDITLGDVLDGISEMVADIPQVCKVAFYAGMLENNPAEDMQQSSKLMREYMKENKLNYSTMFEQIKDWMEKDGFFDLSGLTDYLTKMGESEETIVKEVKKPQDHKRKQTSIK